MPPSIASLTARGRSLTCPSTVLHVLRLVQANYVPESLPLRQLVSSRRQYVSVQPRMEEDLPHLRSTSRPRQIQPLSEGDDRSVERCLTKLGPRASPRSFIRYDPTDEQLINLEVLHRLFLVWERSDSLVQNTEHWVWLSQRMERLVNIAEALASKPIGLVQIIQTLFAYATMKQGDGPIPIMSEIKPRQSIVADCLLSVMHTSREEWRAAKSRLAGAINILAHIEPNEAEVRALRMAQESMVRHGRALDFAEIVKKARRIVYGILLAHTTYRQDRPELVSIFVDGLTALPDPVGWLEEQARKEQAAYDADDSGKERRIKVLPPKIGNILRQAWSSGVGEEEVWKEDEESSNGEKAGEQDIEPAPDLGPLEVPDPFSTLFKAIAGMIFMAHTTSPEVARTGVILFRRLIAWRIFLPPHHAVDLCENLEGLDNSNQRRNVSYITEAILRNTPDLTFSVCKRMLYTLLKFDLPGRAYSLWIHMLARFPNMTRKERRIAPWYYANRGNDEVTLKFLKVTYADQILSDVDSLQAMLVLYRLKGDAVKLEETLVEIQRQVVKSTHVEALIKYYTSQNDTNSALQWFQEFLKAGGQPTVEVFTSLVKLFAPRGDTKNVDKMVQAAIDFGLPLTPEFCQTVLDASVKAQDWITVARRWESLPVHLKTHPIVMTPVLRAFVHLAVPFKTIMSLFRRIANPTRDHWTLIQLAACDKRKPELAAKLLDEMHTRFNQNPEAAKPNSYNYTVVLHGYLRINKDAEAKEIYDAMRRNRVLPSSFTYAMILSAYLEGNATVESLEQAFNFSATVLKLASREQLSDKGFVRTRIRTRLYARLIDNAGRLGRSEQAQKLYRLATAKSPPTIALQTILMTALRRCREYSNVLVLWEETFNYYVNSGIGEDGEQKFLPRSNALCPALSVTLDAMGTVNRYADVKKVWHSVSQAGFGLDAGSYNSYAIALLRCGDIYGAAYVVDRVLLRMAAQVEKRNQKAMRNTLRLERVDTRSREEIERGLDESTSNRPVTKKEVEKIQDAPSAPSDSQPDFRMSYQRKNPNTDFFAGNEAPLGIVRGVLTRWRHGDRQWRPTFVLRSLFHQAFKELRQLVQSESEGKRSGRLILPSFRVGLRDSSGEVAKMSAKELLEDLTRTYPELVRWIEDHETELNKHVEPSRAHYDSLLDRIRTALDRDWADLKEKETQPDLSEAEIKVLQKKAEQLEFREARFARIKLNSERGDPALRLVRSRRRVPRSIVKKRAENPSWWKPFLNLKKRNYFKPLPYHVRLNSRRHQSKQAKERREFINAERYEEEMKLRESMRYKAFRPMGETTSPSEPDPDGQRGLEPGQKKWRVSALPGSMLEKLRREATGEEPSESSVPDTVRSRGAAGRQRRTWGDRLDGEDGVVLGETAPEGVTGHAEVEEAQDHDQK